MPQPTTPPHRLAPTLPRSTRSHTVSLYLVSHTESRSLSHHPAHVISLYQRPTPSLLSRCMQLIVCLATGQRTAQRADTEPRTIRRTIQSTGETHCCCSNCCCAHTLLCEPLSTRATGHRTNPKFLFDKCRCARAAVSEGRRMKRTREQVGVQDVPRTPGNQGVWRWYGAGQGTRGVEESVP